MGCKCEGWNEDCPECNPPETNVELQGAIQPDLKREGCCADTRKPCTYHEGYADGWEAALRLPPASPDRLLESANRLKEHARKALPCIQDAEKAKKLSEAIFAYMDARDGRGQR